MNTCRLTHSKREREAQGVKAFEVEEAKECTERQAVYRFW